MMLLTLTGEKKKGKILTKHKDAYPETQKTPRGKEVLKGKKILSLCCSRNLRFADLCLFSNKLISVTGPGAESKHCLLE